MRRGPTAGDSLTRPVRTQVLHESERTRVTRLFVPGGSMIRKELRGLGAEKRLRHEVEIRERLSGISGVSRMSETQPYPGSILLEDLHGAPLADVPMPLEIDELTRVALGLARVVAETVSYTHLTLPTIYSV